MKRRQDRPPPGSEASLITSEMIEDAMADQQQRVKKDRGGLLEREPQLNAFVQQKLLQIAGKMVMNQVPLDPE